ncbi:MAG: hypothetical protein KDA85_16285, partial [Planctomycetaceae bacterium]|nr:hypothetical protein [Planctomycetaceae bacterium]
MVKYALLLFCVYLGVLVLLAIFQRKLLYQPSRHSHLEVARFPELFELYHEPQDVVLPCEDRVAVRGWLLRHERNSERPLILLFHGNAGDRSGRIG